MLKKSDSLFSVHIFVQITHWLEALAHHMPLEIFVIVASFLEEVIAPIPAFSLLPLVGSLALTQSKGILALFILCLLGSLGKTLGSWLLYWLGDKAEDVLVKKWGKFFGVTHENIEGFSKRFYKTNKDILILSIIRALPVLPSAPISIACGVIKLDLKIYLVGTFIGNIPRNVIFIYLGYGGMQVFRNLYRELHDFSHWFEVSIGVVAVSMLAVFLYWQRKKAEKTKQTQPSK